MTPSDKPKFLETITALASMYSRELDDAAIAMYWNAVEGMTIEQFVVAAQHAANTCRHFPPPVELRPKDSSAEHRAAEAWVETLILARQSSGDHSDPIAAEVIKLMGGGRTLGLCSVEWLETWGRKRFVGLYCAVDAQRALQVQNERLLVDNTIGEIE